MSLFKKLAALTLCAAMSFSLAGCSGSTPGSDTSADEGMRVAMITDYGDITDQSFNQTIYEASREFCGENSIDFTYYRPNGDSTTEKVSMIDKAIADGYNVIVMPGFAFAGAINKTCQQYPDIKFIALDISESDLEGNDSDANGRIYDNVFLAGYQEELAGYMAGYAAVKFGYTKLGFLGGAALPAVIRYGYGFVQGADAAAEEDNVDVSINYAYGNQFYGDNTITEKMDAWYAGRTEIVFACGGSIFTSVGEAAQKVGGKIIGVDVDQAATIDEQFGEDITVTSAMKGLSVTVKTVLGAIKDGKWEDYKGHSMTLGIVDENDPTANYVQLPLDSTQWGSTFTVEDYKELISKLAKGDIKVSNDILAKEPTAKKVKIIYQGNLK